MNGYHYFYSWQNLHILWAARAQSCLQEKILNVHTFPLWEKPNPPLRKTFCCCQQVLVNFVEVSDDFAEVLFSLVSAICQGVMGSCGCWRTWTGHVVWGWPHGSPGGHTACLAPRGAEAGFVVWDDHREGLVCYLDPVLKCRAIPDGVDPAVCSFFISRSFYHPLPLPALLHNTHLITSFPTAPGFAASIPNLSVLTPLPRW